MDNKTEIIDITAMAGKFKNRQELQAYCEKLFIGFKQAVEKLQQLEEENKHLKNLLINSDVVKFEVPTEQAIAEMQLKRLKESAMERILTLDETKQFDLLTKNLYLSKGKPTSAIPAKSKQVDDIPDAELISIAKQDK